MGPCLSSLTGLADSGSPGGRSSIRSLQGSLWKIIEFPQQTLVFPKSLVADELAKEATGLIDSEVSVHESV